MTEQQHTQPIPAPPAKRPPRWPRRHPVITGILAAAAAIIGVIVIIAAVAGTAAQHALQPNTAHAASTQPAATSPATPAATQPPGPDLLAIGSTEEIDQNGQPAATITITRVAVSTQPSDQYGSQPQNGYYVTAHVRVTTNPGYNDSFDASPLDFYALHAGQHYDEGNGNAYDAPGSGSELSGDNLGAGETATGTLIFDLPSPHGKIAYAPNLEGGPIAEWRF